jgi:polyisoprenoid-binding protein YceI
MTDTTPIANTREWQGLTIPAPGSYKLDPTHALVGFIAKHMMVSKVRGHFTDIDATIEIADEPAESTVSVTVGLSSVTTGVEDRDNHLRSADFFTVETNPQMTFVSTSITHVDGNEFTVVGDLTVNGITKPLTLDATFEGVGVNPWGNQVLGFSARGQIDREDWGLTWNAALETGGVLVGKKITIEIDAEFNPAA